MTKIKEKAMEVWKHHGCEILCVSYCIGAIAGVVASIRWANRLWRDLIDAIRSLKA